MMRRSQSVRSRPSSVSYRPSFETDELGLGAVVEKNEEESVEERLRREVLQKDRESDRLLDQLQTLQAQLAQRPPLSAFQEMESDKKALEMILQATQRENEKMMADLERGRKRERILEAELCRIVGDNWQTALNLTSLSISTNTLPPPRGISGHQRSLSKLAEESSDSIISDLPNLTRESPQLTTSTNGIQEEPLHGLKMEELQRTNEVLKAQMEQVKLLVLAMDERLKQREEKLEDAMERAEDGLERAEALHASLD